MINYEVTVVTGDVTFAGTNARVFIQIYGDKGKTEVITLASRSNNFERDTTEIFKVSKFELFSVAPQCFSVDYIKWPKISLTTVCNCSTDRGERCGEDI